MMNREPLKSAHIVLEHPSGRTQVYEFPQATLLECGWRTEEDEETFLTYMTRMSYPVKKEFTVKLWPAPDGFRMKDYAVPNKSGHTLTIEFDTQTQTERHAPPKRDWNVIDQLGYYPED